MLYPLPEPVKAAAKALSDGGFSAYLVGGCVRDILRGAQPHDFDIAASSTPDMTASCFPGRTLILDGVKHGTVAVMIGGEKIEITTFRSESGYSDGRHPDEVSFAKDITDDLSRRDFTVNAMAVPLGGGDCADTSSVVDPFGGREDIARRLIRCVGDPGRRFSEDGLRVMRALRFASALGYEIEPATADSVRSCAGMLGGVSRERIADELYKTAAGEYASSVVSAYPDVIGVAAGTAPTRPELLEKAPRDPLTRLIIMFGDGTSGVLRRLKRSRADIGTAERVSSELGRGVSSREDVYRLLIRLGKDDLVRLLDVKLALGTVTDDDRRSALMTAEDLIAEDVPISVSGLALGGGELAAMGYDGRGIGEIKQRLFEAVVSGKAENSREALMRYLNDTLRNA